MELSAEEWQRSVDLSVQKNSTIPLACAVHSDCKSTSTFQMNILYKHNYDQTFKCNIIEVIFFIIYICFFLMNLKVG